MMFLAFSVHVPGRFLAFPAEGLFGVYLSYDAEVFTVRLMSCTVSYGPTTMLTKSHGFNLLFVAELQVSKAESGLRTRLNRS
jgi:hypothetical protein